MSERPFGAHRMTYALYHPSGIGCREHGRRERIHAYPQPPLDLNGGLFAETLHRTHDTTLHIRSLDAR